MASHAVWRSSSAVIKVLDGSSIEAANIQGCLYRRLELRPTVFLRRFEQLDHLPGAALLSMAGDERLPDSIETFGPQAGFPHLLQRPGARHCPGLRYKTSR